MKNLGKLLFAFGLLLGIVVFVLLLVYTFSPDIVHVDKYTFYFLGFLLFLLLLPTLKSGKFTYLFEFKRNVGGLKGLVKKLTKKR